MPLRYPAPDEEKPILSFHLPLPEKSVRVNKELLDALREVVKSLGRIDRKEVHRRLEELREKVGERGIWVLERTRDPEDIDFLEWLHGIGLKSRFGPAKLEVVRYGGNWILVRLRPELYDPGSLHGGPLYLVARKVGNRLVVEEIQADLYDPTTETGEKLNPWREMGEWDRILLRVAERVGREFLGVKEIEVRGPEEIKARFPKIPEHILQNIYEKLPRKEGYKRKGLSWVKEL